ncbi:MAG TPA: hypothetical protein VFA98_06515 [Thermoanaerobaculia bacterium]|nr:hypothetical protein [Thermoanaerobaculia bacterium]
MDKFPAALVLVALIVCSTILAWKGTIPSHAFFMVAGGALAWAVPKIGQVFSQEARAARRSHPEASGEFSPEEVSTNPEGRTAKDKKE